MRVSFFLVLGLAMWASHACGAAPAELPNVVVILADDLGYADLSCQGSTTLATPRLDRMAREGVRFTAAYAAAPFCSPSRAALLTGRLPARAGLPYVLFPAEHHGLPAAEITLAELLRERGYATACIGKWHLGWAAPFRPQRQGFEVFFGLPYSNDSTEWPVGEPFMQVMGLGPLPLLEGDRVIEAPVDQAHLTRRYTERAVAFLRENRHRPFFLYLPHTMPHTPQYASPPFAGKSRGGLYGDTVEEIDWSTGVILDTLRELGLDERTLVLFTSDNGAPARGGAGAANAAKQKQAPPGGGRFPGRSLAGSNGPLRGGKGTTYEGGIRVPWIARWPTRITPDRVVAEPVSLLDVFPTVAALAGVALPADRTYDGADLGAVLTGAGPAAGGPRTLYHYFGYQPQAVRRGAWKLLLAAEPAPNPRPPSLWWEHQPQIFDRQHRVLAEPELYDLDADPGEKRNVAKEHPARVAELTQQVRGFNAALQRDLRPMEFAPGPPPPPPGAVRAAGGGGGGPGARLGLGAGPGGTVLKDGRPYRGIGVNYFDCFLRTLKDGADTSYAAGFAALSEQGIPFARFCATGFWPKDMALYQQNRDEYFRRLDGVVRAAEQHGIGLVPSLFWQLACVPDLVGESIDQWGNPESRTHAWMRRYVEEIVTRYRASPAIWLWELGNEFNLAIDLPNAAQHRPKIVPALGTPSVRTERDELQLAHLRVAVAEFARAVRALDPHRIVVTGHAMPRPAAWHMQRERTWQRDDERQFAEALGAQHPDPVNALSVHVYEAADVGRLDWLRRAAQRMGQPVFVGEFGVQAAGKSEAMQREEFPRLLQGIVEAGFPLAALWVYDYPRQPEWNCRADNDRAWQLAAVAAANRRLQH